MPSELSIAPAASPTTASPVSGSASEAQTGSGDFVAALADALSAEAAVVEAGTPLVTALPLEELENGEDLLDATAMFIDPQALMSSLEQAQRTEVTVQTETGARAIGLGSKSDHAQLAALSLSAGAGEEKGAALSASLLESSAANSRGGELTEGRSDAKSGNENSGAAVFAANATAHERVTELRERPVIRSHVGTAAWTEEIAGRLTLMVGRGMQSASLTMSPEHLGPLEIRISIQNDNASVWFGAAHAETRTALEQALPRLREMLAGQGLNLSDAGVFKQTPQQQQQQSYSGSAGARLEGEREFSVAVGMRGIVDAYA
jgi:flagellar hook-length control protein FliK